MKSNPTINKTTISKPTKATKKRITALILALLLTATVLIPQIPVKAQESTVESADISENNSSGTSAGAGDNLPIDTAGNASFKSRINYKGKGGNGANFEEDLTDTFYVEGKGHFNVRTLELVYSSGRHEYRVFIFSDKPFTFKVSQLKIHNGETTVSNNYDSGSVSAVSSFGSSNYYYKEIILTAYLTGETLSISSPNLLTYSDDSGMTVDIQKKIENTLDLSKDDYISDEDKADMTPVRDESIGYLPRARYFDNRNNSELSFDYYNDYTATIQWDSFQEPYASDLDNPYYVEIYAQIHYKLGKASNTSNVKMCQYKKYGEVKYVSERFTFPHREPADNYLLSIGAHLWSQIEGLNPDSDMAIVERNIKHYYVRLLHYDYDKQQLLCGGWTRLTLDENGGCTSEPGDFPPDNEDDWTPDDPDKDPDKWDDTGDEKDPNKPDPDNPDPDNPDFGIDTSDIGKFILSLISSLLNSIKSILLLVGEFPSLCGHVFSFLPNDIGTLMFCGTAAIIFMRFLGR